MRKYSYSTLLLLLALSFNASAAPDGVEKTDVLKKIAESGDFAPMFPFQPTHDAPANITNVSTWDGVENMPAGKKGFIGVSEDHFIDGNGREIRFLGTNICFTGCFPQKGDAEKLAVELTRYGINVVRLHYVHHKKPAAYPSTDSFIEPEQLDRFDYLLSCLKKNGIYTYFQLNIARKFGAANGFENADKLPWYNNGLDNVDFNMIRLQKKFVSEILNHVNPYTGLAYKAEPAISMMELANENSIINAWFTPKYNMPLLTEPYRTDLKDMWNRWLKMKYPDTNALREAWCAPLKGDGSVTLTDGIFNENYFGRQWSLQTDKTGISAWKVEKAEGKDKLKGKYFARIRVDELGKNDKMPQFFRSGIAFEAMTPYTLTLKARADRSMRVKVRFSQAHTPFAVAGLNADMDLSTKWKEYKFEFVTSLSDDNVRLVVSGFSKGIVDVADISMTSGIDFKWPEGQSLEDGTIDWPYARDWSTLSMRAKDFTEFLRGLESAYFGQMARTVKERVGAVQPVAGTQLQYGFDLPQASLDYCDVHSYWCHPSFPGKSWDPSSMRLKNRSLSNGDALPGTNLMSIARSRIMGRPLTVSEYDNPNLNLYSAEGNIMAAALGAFQNWSAIIQFAWSHNTDFFREVMSPQFDMCSAPQKLAHLPACYAMFVRGDVKKGDGGTVFLRDVTTQDQVESIASSRNTRSTIITKGTVMSNLPLAVVTGKNMKEIPGLYSDSGCKVIRKQSDVPEDILRQYKDKQVSSTTGELTWNWQTKGAGYFKVDAARTKVFSGFVRGRNFEFDGMRLTPGRNRLDWLTLSLTQARGISGAKPSGRLAPGSYLLAATGLCHNSGEVIVDLGRDDISCGSANGGAEGTAPVLCEGIDATLEFSLLAGRVKCFALAPDGSRMREVAADARDGSALLRISPEYKTVWYEIIID